MKKLHASTIARGFVRPISVLAISLITLIAIMIFGAIGQARAKSMQNLPYGMDVTDASEVSFSSIAELAESRLDEPLTAGDVKGSWYTVRMRVTAYCPCSKCCGKYSDGITANGHTIRWGDRFVAAPRGVSFGTEMVIPGYNSSKSVKVFDRGRLITDGKLDVFFNTHSQAKRWGVKHLNVRVKY